jgi:urea transporter
MARKIKIRIHLAAYTATLAAGYGSVLGFNLRQMIRHQQGKINYDAA